LDISETQEDFPIYLNLKRSKLHKIVSHPLIFPCIETIDWVLQNIDKDSWTVRDHTGAPLATISPTDISTYYKLPERQVTFNTWWLSSFVTSVKDILREW